MSASAKSVTNDAPNPYRIYNHVEPPIGPDGTPCAYYEVLRDRAAVEPIGWSEQLGGFWVAAGYDVVRQILRSTDDFSVDAVVWPAYNTGSDERMMIAAQDDPEHKLYRGLVQQDFSPRSVRDYEEPVQHMTSELIDGFIEDGRCEVSDVIADEIPALLTALFLGLDTADSATYRQWVEVIAHGMDDADAMQAVLGDMYAYFSERVEAVRKAPGDDVLSKLTRTQIDGRPLTNDELIGFCVVLLIGGIHNSAKVMSNAFWRLGWDVELRRRLARDPALIPAATEEFMRFYTPGQIGRSVIADSIEIGGVTLKKGDIIILALSVANRDASQFDYPDEFIVNRKPNAHVGLGHGLHACLGGSLIRVEVNAVLQEFLRRIPECSLDTSEKTSFWQQGQTSGMTDVVLRFPPGRRVG